MTQRELDIQINHSMFWTDSTAVSKYIKNENKRLHIIVANRLAVIHDGTQQTQWSYMESSSNPGDDTSRGLSTSELIKSKRWIYGPVLLWQDTTQRPKVESTVNEIS